MTLERLISHGAAVIGVLGLSYRRSSKVSDYARFDDVARQAGADYIDFENINDERVVEALRVWRPDVFFVVGLSQLVGPAVMAIPRKGCIGFHPTRLPKGRGRAPIAWLTYDASPGAATFFLIDDGVDSGPIFVQEPFSVSAEDYSADVIESARKAIVRALDRWLPSFLQGEWDPQSQDDKSATYFGRRTEQDGLIDWHRPAHEIHRLIRAASRPYPGAYTYYGNTKLIVWRASLETSDSYRGVVGRILATDDRQRALIQTGEGLLWLDEVELEGNGPPPKVGVKLGKSFEDELILLSSRVTELEKALAASKKSE